MFWKAMSITAGILVALVTPLVLVIALLVGYWLIRGRRHV